MCVQIDFAVEKFLLFFTIGFTTALIAGAFVRRFSWALLALVLVSSVFVMWYSWAIYGVDFVAKLLESQATEPGKEALSMTTRGQVGDLFGGINALFAALAFAGIAGASLMQARTLEITARQHRQQSFEPLFFHLLELHRNVSAKKLTWSSQPAGGLIVGSGPTHSVDIARAVHLLRRDIRMKTVGFTGTAADRQQLAKIASELYLRLYVVNQDELGPHFRSLFHIFKLIDGSSFSKGEKVRYSNIARATLGKDQLFLLAVNCLSSYGKDFKPLVENYGLLKHVDQRPTQLNIDLKIAAWCYKDSAMQGSDDREMVA